MSRKPTHEQMVRYARPLVDAGGDWQEIQHEILNNFESLTNSDEDGEAIMDAIRECEADLEERNWKKSFQRER